MKASYRATTSFYFDRREGKARKDGTFTVRLRVVFQRRNKAYTTGASFLPEEWEAFNGPNPKGRVKKEKLRLQALQARAEELIAGLGDAFSFAAFEKAFLSAPEAPGERDLAAAFDRHTNMLLREGRVSTADTYRCARNSFNAYRKRAAFADITPEWLRGYERWMLANGRSITSAGIYLRCLRTVFNTAIHEKRADPETYPFGRRKFTIPAGRNIKKALAIADIEKLFRYRTDVPREEWARDMWVFSYLCYGMNFKDIASLRWKDIRDGKIAFERAKTRNTKRDIKQVEAIVTPEVEAVLGRWGTPGRDPEAYVFPVFEKGMDEAQKDAAKRGFIKTANKYLGRIGEKIGLARPLRTNDARHSFATVLKRGGTPISLISEMLKHRNIATTEHYLDSFEDDSRIEAVRSLTNFGGEGK